MDAIDVHVRWLVAAPIYGCAYALACAVFRLMLAGLIGGLAGANLVQLFATGLPVRSIVLGLVLTIVCGTHALALPGQSKTEFLAWAKTNPALGTLQVSRSELSGGSVYFKQLRVGSLKATFSAEPGPLGVQSERVFLNGVADGYDLRKHREVSMQLLQAVYGGAVASDLRAAKIAGDFGFYQQRRRQTILKGARYGYALNANVVEVFRLRDVAERLKEAKQCEKMECGD